VDGLLDAGRASLSASTPGRARFKSAAIADLVVYDPHLSAARSRRRTAIPRSTTTRNEGWERKGRASVVTVRGVRSRARDGKFVGKIGRGQFLKRGGRHTSKGGPWPLAIGVGGQRPTANSHQSERPWILKPSARSTRNSSFPCVAKLLRRGPSSSPRPTAPPSRTPTGRD